MRASQRVGSLLLAAAAGTLAMSSLGGGAQAQAAAPGRVFIVWAPGLMGADLARADVAPALQDASLALVSTRTARSAASDTTMHATTLGAGERVEGPAGATLLARALEGAGYAPLGVVRPGAPTATAQQVFGAPPPILAAPDLDAVAAIAGHTAAVIDVGGDHARLAAAVLDLARADDLVVIAGVVPSPARLDQQIRLGVVAIAGPGFRRGVLSSPTTRRRGLIALVDLAPTIAHAVGRGGAVAEGRVAQVHPDPEPSGEIRALEGELLEARAARTPVTRTALYASMALAALLGIALLRATRWSASVERVLRPLAAGVMALPLAGFVSTALPGDAVLVTLVGGGLAAAAAWLTGPRRVAIAVALGTALVPLADLVAGAPLAHRSPWGLLLSGGGRFYGVSEDAMGLICGGAIAAAGLLVRTRRALLVAVTAFAIAVAVCAAPGFGAKFGAAPTLVPAFAVFAVLAVGRRIDLKVLAAIAVATVLATGGSVLADRLRPERTRSHVARALDGETDVGALLSRKWDANAQITFTSAWGPAAVVAGAGLVLLRRRRRLAEGLEPAVLAGAAGAAAAIVVNDGGIIAAAAIAVVMQGAAAASARRSPATDVEP